MKLDRKSRRILLSVCVPVLIVAVLVSAFFAFRPTFPGSNQAEVLPDATPSAEELLARIPALEDQERITDIHYKTVLDLSMADAPGRPGSVSGAQTCRPGFVTRFSARPSFFDTIAFQAPKAGARATAGSTFALKFELANPDGSFAFDILLSTNGGTNFTPLATKKKFTTTTTVRTYSLVIPDQASTNCVFRVIAWLGDTLYAQGDSPKFTIAPAATPTPPPSATPMPSLTPLPTAAPLAPHYSRTKDLFVDRSGDPTRWISLDVQTKEATRIVWQVSRTPFAGFAANALDPVGLLASGEIPADQSEFLVDFGAILDGAEHSDAPERENTGASFDFAKRNAILPQDLYDLYIRAVAVDSNGDPIGDPGTGLQFQFGTPSVEWNDAVKDIVDNLGKPRIWFGRTNNLSGEYDHLDSKGMLFGPSDASWPIQFRDRPAGVVSEDLQIATSPFEDGVVENPKGLVKSFHWGENFSYSAGKDYSTLPLSEFVPSKAEIGTKTMTYYVRKVYFLKSPDSVTARIPVVSESQVFSYCGIDYDHLISSIDSSSLLPKEQVTVKSHVPMTRFLRYVPVQFEAEDWKDQFVVTRRILAKEMTFKVTIEGGPTLYPYGDYHFETYPLGVFVSKDPSMSEAHYQELLDQWLPIGSHIRLLSDDSQSLWGEMWSLASEIWTSVANAYMDAKETFVNTVIDVLPFDDDVKAVLKKGLKFVVDATLTYVGIPPTLPNFSELAEGGIDYALTVAVNEACAGSSIPITDITEEQRKELAAEVRKQFEAAAASGALNPLDVDFLAPDPRACYRPGYVEIDVTNFGNEPSATGTGILTYSNTGGGYYSVYRCPKFPIPSLLPHQTLIIRKYLQENTEDWQIFENLFQNGDKVQLYIECKYDLPDVKVAAEAQGLTDRSDALVFTFPEYVYDHPSVYRYYAMNRPSNIMLDEDPDVDVTVWMNDDR